MRISVLLCIGNKIIAAVVDKDLVQRYFTIEKAGMSFLVQ